jgi:hypothetical protein
MDLQDIERFVARFVNHPSVAAYLGGTDPHDVVLVIVSCAVMLVLAWLMGPRKPPLTPETLDEWRERVALSVESDRRQMMEDREGYSHEQPEPVVKVTPSGAEEVESVDDSSTELKTRAGNKASKHASPAAPKARAFGLAGKRYILDIAAKVYLKMGARPKNSAQMRAARVLAGRLMTEDGHRTIHVERDLPQVLLALLTPTRAEEEFMVWMETTFSEAPSSKTELEVEWRDRMA